MLQHYSFILNFVLSHFATKQICDIIPSHHFNKHFSLGWSAMILKFTRMWRTTSVAFAQRDTKQSTDLTNTSKQLIWKRYVIIILWKTKNIVFARLFAFNVQQTSLIVIFLGIDEEITITYIFNLISKL